VGIQETVAALEALIADPRGGLPEEIFLFTSRITPMINVDLLIKNESNHTLLTWRDDGYSPPGWHIPGGVIRFKETAAGRIKAVARAELGAEVTFRPEPLAIKEIIHPARATRGHFISMLFRCTMSSPPDESLRCSGIPRQDQWMWHDGCPRDILDVHAMYREFIESPSY
jgi:colanic acid biosynthesis protein WcaH